MILYIKNIYRFLKEKIYNSYVFIFSIIALTVSWIFSSLHYTNIYYGNNLSWISWLFAVAAFSYSFLPKKISFKKYLSEIERPDILLSAFIIVIYSITHLWNFSVAPWNQNGLFDDAAWDIYFAKNHAFKFPFQAAFFDEVGYISREVVFHYYITGFFKLFGYNLLVFNISLLVLGFITVFFTTFIIQRLFKNTLMTLISVFVINFFPLHYNHIFMGHRYAIAAPLLVTSLYFLYTALANKSLFRAIISAFFAALTFGSAVMGKQYILGLILSAILVLVFVKRERLSKENVALGFVWIAGFIFSATPLLVYIIFNYHQYVVREQGLLQDFFRQFSSGGSQAIKPYFDQVIELFFAKFTYRRQFLPDFPIIPFAYYILLVPGIMVAFIKRRFEIVLLSLIPTFGAFVSGSYDFRVLLSVPVWVIAMAFGFDYILKFKTKSQATKIGLMLVGFLTVLWGIVPSAVYLWRVSRDPNHVYLLPHKDVAVSRLMQDIVVGAPNPTSGMKPDEFNRKVTTPPSYDTLACPYSSYAIAHLYLQDFDDKKILALCNQGIQLLKTPQEILDDSLNAISKYRVQNKDLKLVWEVSEKSKRIIDNFSKYKRFGTEETLLSEIDGNSFSLYILTIENDSIKAFQKEIGEITF